MLRIAIVEDEAPYAQTLVAYCGRYGGEKDLELHADHFGNPAQFLDRYRGEYDLVLMDILMPMMDGMECARRLREKDENVLLCFVTNMAQYAIRGYEVGAFDFLIKPVKYGEFAMKMDRILRTLARRETATVLISSRSTVKKVAVRDLYYVEVYNHSLIYHTGEGDYESYGRLSSLENDERFRSFIKISNSHLVNCAHISSVEGDTVVVEGIPLAMSRRRKRECMERLATVLGGVSL